MLAVLKMKFARTVALALGIADNIKKPLTKLATPALSHATGPDLEQVGDGPHSAVSDLRDLRGLLTCSTCLACLAELPHLA